MKREDQYKVFANELAHLIKSKNDEISLLRWRVTDLEARLKEAEVKE